MSQLAILAALVLAICPALGVAGYTIDWELTFPEQMVRAVAPVQDTLMWVSSAGTVNGDSTKAILVYDIGTLSQVDSFPIPSQDREGYFDLTYVGDSNHVLCVRPVSESLDVLDASSHELVRRFTCSGPEPCLDPAGVGWDGESLYVVSWDDQQIHKMALDGANCRCLCPTPLGYSSGVGVNASDGMVYVTAGDRPRSRVGAYDCEEVRFRDAWDPDELRWMGGSDVWRDSCLLAVGDAGAINSSRVVCLSLSPNPADAALTAINAPDPVVRYDSVRPEVVLTNLGPAPIGEFPVCCLIDSAGTSVFRDTAFCGITLPGARFNALFPSAWHPADGAEYDITFFLALDSDTNPANDTIRRRVVVGVDEATGASEQVGLLLTPSPFRGRFSVRRTIAVRAAMEVELLDVAGMCVDRVVLKPGEMQAELPTYPRRLPSGIYYVRTRGRTQFIRKTVKLD